MDPNEFKRLLYLFPVVRPRDYQAELASSSETTSQSGQAKLKQSENEGNDEGKTVGSSDAFWGKLRSAAEKKVGAADAEKFLIAFRQVYEKLVRDGLSEAEAQRFINSQC